MPAPTIVSRGLRAALALPILAAAAFSATPLGAAEVAGNVYFGDLHLHKRYSNDAFSFGTWRTPDDAYLWAKGAALYHAGAS